MQTHKRTNLVFRSKDDGMFLSSDPEVWFIESSHGMVSKTKEESTVPCVVTNPNIRVTLHDKDTDLSIEGVYVPGEGFKAYLEYRTYVCRGELNGEVKESQPYNVYSIHGAYGGHVQETKVLVTRMRILIYPHVRTTVFHLT